MNRRDPNQVSRPLPRFPIFPTGGYPDTRPHQERKPRKADALKLKKTLKL